MGLFIYFASRTTFLVFVLIVFCCDFFGSDGIGFGITHSMVTMMFEASLQAVNPKLSLPYWDFTIESYIIDTQHDGDYTKLREISDLWTSEWFGGVDDSDFQVCVCMFFCFVFFCLLGYCAACDTGTY